MTQTKIGHKIIHLERVDSTNNYAANMGKQGQISHGTVILADIQTNGRGQRGNTWQSDPFSNLTMSLYITPNALIKNNQHTLNYAVSLALKDVLTKHAENVNIKWPNDILIGKRKIAGILIENQWGPFGIQSCIVGIGLNLNQQSFENDLGISLSQASGKHHTPYNIMLEFCYTFQERWNSMEQVGADTLKQEFDKALWLRGIESTFVDAETQEEFNAILVDTDEFGNLRLQKENGRIESYRNQSIRFKDRMV
ncbi:biotin--[acetyl-CoA-carboxylase] ligase [Lishizhenia sp.]|uniref:biotin--[acetyl-CoA-carboxylase] ligase n=1 Tax=Lishizhenia sp. TaxID=2497594 RepID=UPI00299D45D6|nr:biotin--[acetyl-CoA-carboxylase] ligase [Lishizhenia sp.]MDX1446081.1 biotin--[acetyl-CoA-carboxylase] ligase [Lishizhenia sp.]